jgi:hypothetical protein
MTAGAAVKTPMCVSLNVETQSEVSPIWGFCVSKQACDPQDVLRAVLAP